MQNPRNYKTEYGLYRATMKALETPGMKKAWFVHNAEVYCRERFPELLPQLLKLIADAAPRTFDELIPVGHN